MKFKFSYLLIYAIIFFGGGISKLFPNLDITLIFSILFILFNVKKVFPNSRVPLVPLISVFFIFFSITALYSHPIDIYTKYYSRTAGSINNLNVFFRILGYFFITIIVSNIYFHKDVMKIIKVILIINSLFISLAIIVEFYTGFNYFRVDSVDIIMEGVYRVRGPFGDPNSSAAMIIPGLIALISILIFDIKSKSANLFILGSIAFLLWGISFTASRTVLIGIIVFLPFIFCLNKEIISFRKKIIISILMSISGSFFIAILLRGRSLSFSSDGSAQSRSDLFFYALDLVSDNPLLGVGYQYGFHNNLSDIMLSGGFLLLSIFVVFNVMLLYRLFKFINQKDFWFLFSLNISFFVVGLGISWTNNIIYWFVIGISISVLSNYKNNLLIYND